MEMIKARNDNLRADMINNNNNLNDHINNSNDNMIENNQDFSNKIESLPEKIELRASFKASSRANTPGQLMTKLHAKLPAYEEPVVMETPRIVVMETPRIIVMETPRSGCRRLRGRERRRAPVSSRDDTHSYRDTFTTTNRVGNPIMRQADLRPKRNQATHASWSPSFSADIR